MKPAIIVPSISIDPLLERCVRECRIRSPRTEIIVLVDDDADRTRIGDLATVIVTGPVAIGAKRNLGAQSTKADLLAFIDSDAYPAEGWLQTGRTALLDEDRSLGAVGGPNVSPPSEPRNERYVGLAHQSFLVDGWWTYRRRRTSKAQLVSALPTCNLVVRRDDYMALGGMREDLFTGEDTDFCHRLTNRGRPILFSPDVCVYHKNRSLRGFAVQRFTFGVALVPMLGTGARLGIAYGAVSAALVVFVLILATAPVALLVRPWRRFWSVVAGAYGSVLAFEAIRHADRPRVVPGTALALAIGNLAPGIGALMKAVGLAPDLRGTYRNDR